MRRMSLTISLISQVWAGVTMNSLRKGSASQRGCPGGAHVEIGSHSTPLSASAMRSSSFFWNSGVSFAVGGPPAG
jgi:hypothetical protein